MPKSILCVDDNQDHCEILRLFFELEGYQFYSCSTTEECLEYREAETFSAIILDNILRFENGEELFTDVKNAYPKIPIFFFTADAQVKSREKAMRLGAADYLVKPNDLERIVSVIDGHVNLHTA